jgi:hypothetical protein
MVFHVPFVPLYYLSQMSSMSPTGQARRVRCLGSCGALERDLNFQQVRE